MRDRREGRQTNYKAQPQGLVPLIDWMSLYGAFWRERFDRLETLLNRSAGDQTRRHHAFHRYRTRDAAPAGKSLACPYSRRAD